MNTIIVVKIIPNIFPGKFTIVIISMVPLSHLLIQPLVEKAEKISSIARPVIKHANDKAEVDEGQHAHDPPKPLHWVEEVEGHGPKIREAAKENHAPFDPSHPVVSNNLVSLLGV